MTDQTPDDVTDDNFLQVLEEASNGTSGLMDAHGDSDDQYAEPAADTDHPEEEDVDDSEFLSQDDADALDEDAEPGEDDSVDDLPDIPDTDVVTEPVDTDPEPDENQPDQPGPGSGFSPSNVPGTF